MKVGQEEQQPSVLLLRLSSLGDIVQALPLALLLCERGHRVSWLIESRFRELCALVAMPIDWQIWERGWLSTLRLRRLGGEQDLVCDLQGNWKSALCALVIAGGKSWRPARVDLRETSSMILPSRHAKVARAPHILERSFAVVEAALQTSLEWLEPDNRPFLKAGQTCRHRIRAELRALGIPDGKAFVVQVLGSSTDPRSWPLGRVLDLEAQLAMPHLLLCGPAEASLVLRPDLPVLRQGQGSLEDLVALGGLLAEQGGIALGHDGGAMHVLRASGARTLFLFGPQDPARTGPHRERVIQAPLDLPCRPCLQRSCHLAEGNLCMDKIPVEVVRRELERLLQKG